MSDLPEPTRPAHAPAAALRAGDADREAVAELLRTAAGEGRLTLGELDERLEAAYAARTFADLEPLTRDLPTGAAVVPGPAPERERLVAVFSDEKRAGRWEVPEYVEARSIFGDVTLDLTDAVSRHAEVVVDAYVVFGDVKVVVPEGVAVTMEPGTTVFGDRSSTALEPSGTPALRVRVRGTVIFGDLSVRPPKQKRRWLPRG